MEIAKLFQTASISYHGNPTALHLRAMNMLYEGLKEKGAMMIVPSTAVESMGMGGLMGMAAMAQRQLTDSANPVIASGAKRRDDYRRPVAAPMAFPRARTEAHPDDS